MYASFTVLCCLLQTKTKDIFDLKYIYTVYFLKYVKDTGNCVSLIYSLKENTVKENFKVKSQQDVYFPSHYTSCW